MCVCVCVREREGGSVCVSVCNWQPSGPEQKVSFFGCMSVLKRVLIKHGRILRMVKLEREYFDDTLDDGVLL